VAVSAAMASLARRILCWIERPARGLDIDVERLRSGSPGDRRIALCESEADAKAVSRPDRVGLTNLIRAVCTAEHLAIKPSAA
jgi:hypothetical protein